MKTNVSKLSEVELRVYSELAHASVNGICSIPMKTLKHRCGLSDAEFKKALESIERNGLIEQKIQGRGVPRIFRLVNEWEQINK